MSSILFVNLPLASIARGAPYLALFLERGLNPELGIDAFVLDELSLRWHERQARQFAEAGLIPAVHLPFMDLRPGAADPAILNLTRERLGRAMDVATIYGARHMVGHACFVPGMDGPRAEDWLAASVDTWNGLLAARPEAPLLVLENTYETGYQPLLDLVSRLDEGRAGLCLDLGHWHSFGQGVAQHNLGDWIKAVSPYLKHLHLHDNDGSSDQHLGLGQGAIPFDELFAVLARHGLAPTMTLEPHTVEDFEHSARFMAQHPQWFAAEES